MKKRYPRMGLGAALIPWKEDFSFDEALFRKGVRNLAEGGLKYVYIFGTAGEGYAVNDEEFTEITKTFIDELAGTDTTPIVGVICLSATQILRRLEIAYDLGARDFQISFPSW